MKQTFQQDMKQHRQLAINCDGGTGRRQVIIFLNSIMCTGKAQNRVAQIYKTTTIKARLLSEVDFTSLT